jgi:hypothetical protein
MRRKKRVQFNVAEKIWVCIENIIERYEGVGKIVGSEYKKYGYYYVKIPKPINQTYDHLVYWDKIKKIKNGEPIEHE